MNRRSFLRNSALALFGFTVLPPASTYQRIWKATRDTTIEKVELIKPIALPTPFRFLDSMHRQLWPPPPREPMPGEVSSLLLETLFPLHYGRSR